MLMTGKDHDYVRYEMDMIRMRALSAYHDRFPPTHVGVQRLCRIIEAFMGIDDDSEPDDIHGDDDDELLSDLRNFPQGG